MVTTVYLSTPTEGKINVAGTRSDDVVRESMDLVKVPSGETIESQHTSAPRAVHSLQKQCGNESNIILAPLPESTLWSTEADMKTQVHENSTPTSQKAAGVDRQSEMPKMTSKASDKTTVTVTMTTSHAPNPNMEGQYPSPPSIMSSLKYQDEGKEGGENPLVVEMPSGEGGTHCSSNSCSDDDAREDKEPDAEAPPQWDPKTPWPMKDIVCPGINDCLMGRGGGTNHHTGNKRFRALTETRKPKYLLSKRLDKPIVAMEIIHQWRSLEPPGRFLKQDSATKLWYDVGDQKAREKTSQALREKMTYSMVGEEGLAIGKPTGTKEMDPEDKKGIWTEAEMQLVREAQKVHGNKWSEVAKHVKGRSENSVKNWWYNHKTSQRRKKKREIKRAEQELTGYLPRSEIRKRKKVKRQEEAVIIPPSKNYAHALIPSSHQGQQGNQTMSPDNWTYLNEEASPRTVIDTPGSSPNTETRQGMAGGSIESSSDGGSNFEFGAVGYKFSRQLEGANGEDLGWYDGIVVDILSGTDKDRKCLYFANGFVEDLSLVDLTEIAQLESNRHF